MGRRARHSSTEGRGINIIRTIVENTWGWLVRDQREHDYGVDLHVEVVDAGIPSGRLLALQVKSGRSFFRSGKKATVRHQVSAGHRDYWLNHSLPVVLTLVDTESCRVYWEQVTVSTVRRTPRAWAIDVPLTQMLDDSGAATLRRSARPATILERAQNLRNSLTEVVAGHDVEFDMTVSPTHLSLAIRPRVRSILFELVVPEHADPAEVEALQTFFSRGQREVRVSGKSLRVESDVLARLLEVLQVDRERASVVLTNTMVGRTFQVYLAIAEIRQDVDLQSFSRRVPLLRDLWSATLEVEAWGSVEQRFKIVLDDGPFWFRMSSTSDQAECGFNYDNQPFHAVAASERVASAVYRGCRWAVLLPDRAVVAASELQPQPLGRPDLLETFDLFARLAELSGIDLRLDRDITAADVEAAREATTLLAHGVRHRGAVTVRIPVPDLQRATRFLDALNGVRGPPEAEMEHPPDTIVVLGQEIPIPRTRIRLSEVAIEPEEIAKLKRMPFEAFKICIRSAPGATVTQELL